MDAPRTRSTKSCKLPYSCPDCNIIGRLRVIFSLLSIHRDLARTREPPDTFTLISAEKPFGSASLRDRENKITRVRSPRAERLGIFIYRVRPEPIETPSPIDDQGPNAKPKRATDNEAIRSRYRVHVIVALISGAISTFKSSL